jgi:hypothetical protein
MRRQQVSLVLILLALLLAACGGAEVGAPGLAPAAPEEQATAVVEEPAWEEPESLPTAEAGEQAPVEPVDDQTTLPAPQPDNASSPDPLDSAIAYNLPPATLLTETGLYVSPNRDDLVAPVIIPAGETIYLMGRNATYSHLRAVWNTGVGWVPVSFTSYNGDRELLDDLPEFEQEPPRCAEPVTTQFNLGSVWTADQRMRVAIVVDLFRSRYGDFPQSYLLLNVNGAAVESSRRAIVERGQFSLKDIVFSLPGYLQPGDTLGYSLETSTDESLAFMATIFRVPEGCVWDVE